MVTDPPPSEPWAGDLVQLRAAARPFADHPGTWYTVAGIPAPGVLELNHQSQHPGYWDWAAAVDVREAVAVRRLTPNGTRSWTRHRADGGRPR